MSAVDQLLSLFHEVTVIERNDLIAALRLAAEQYSPCDECGAAAAEWWLWSEAKRIWDDPEPTMASYCEACVGDRKEACMPAEPEDHIAAIAKVRRLIGKAHVDPIAEMAEENLG